MKSMSGVVPASYGTLPEEAQAQARARLAFAAQRGWYFDEWGHMLKQIAHAESAMAGFHGFLRVLDDGKTRYANDTILRGYEEITHPYLALMTAATIRDLAPFMGTGSSWWRDGFWPRFAFVTPADGEEASTQPRPRERYQAPASLIEPLHTWHQALGVPVVDVQEVMDVKSGKGTGVWHATTGALPQHVLGLSTPVWDAYDAYNIALLSIIQAGDVSPDFHASYGRLHEKALRIALLLASFQGCPTIEMRHWAYAQAVVEGWRIGMHTLVDHVGAAGAPDTQSQEEARVEHLLAAMGRATLRDIQRHMYGMTSEKLLRILNAMARADKISYHKEGRQTWYSMLPYDAD